MYQVEFRPAAWRELQKLEKRFTLSIYEALEAAIDGLAKEPRPQGCRKLTNTDYLRIKAAHDYRIIYLVQDNEKKVIIIRVAKRTESSYKFLP